MLLLLACDICFRNSLAVALYGWPAKADDSFARNQTKDSWTWNLAVSGSGKGTRKRVGWKKVLAGSWRLDSREASQQRSWRGTTDRGSQHRTPEKVAEKRGSSHSEEDWVKRCRHSSCFVEFSSHIITLSVCQTQSKLLKTQIISMR